MTDRWVLWAMAALAVVMGMPVRAAGSLTLYVSHDGNDNWSGRLAAPARSGKDGPLATLEAARDAIRSLRSSRAIHGAVQVCIRGGVYERTTAFVLESRDGGSPDARVTYGAYGREAVTLRGGRQVRDWSPVTDPAVLDRMDPSARGKVLVADLKSQGITDYGRLMRRGFGVGGSAALDLTFDGKPMTLARWPNDGWATIAGAPKGQEGGQFTYTGDRPSRWSRATDIWLHGYWTFDWADTYERVAAIDTASRTISTEPPHGAYGYSPGRRWYALNLLEELDSPGEWWLDRETGRLYFWPPEPIAGRAAVVSLLADPLIDLRQASNVTLEGITLECGRGSAVTMSGCTASIAAGVTIRNMGGTGMVVDGGAGCGAQSCDIYQVGEGGLSLSGGDRKTLTPCGHFAVNCHIHDHSAWCRTYRPAIGIYGVGVRATHNLIHDGPHNAILLGGNDHVIEYNDISRVCTQTGDAGAVYMGRDWSMRGTVVRYNRFHDVGPQVAGGEPGRYTEVMSVYLDDCYCGTTIQGNLFVRAGRSIMVGGGRDNVIEGNVFVDCRPSIHIDQRGKGWAAGYIKPNGGWDIFENLRRMDYDKPPYSTRYTHLAQILDDDPAAAKYNRVTRNIHVGKGQWIDWLDGLSDRVVEVKDNWTQGDPGFVDAARGDYRLAKGGPAARAGHVSLPIDKMGMYRDRYRRQLEPAK